MSNTVNTLTIVFNQQIEENEIPLFRGSIINAMAQSLSRENHAPADVRNVNVLFHNHQGEEGHLYSYPLIQYKRVDGKAAVVAVNDGIDKIYGLLEMDGLSSHIGRRPVTMEAEGVLPMSTLIELGPKSKYRLKTWLPFNHVNYMEYRKLEGLAERVSFLERILVGNVLSMLKGLGFFVNDEVRCVITDLSRPCVKVCKGVQVMAFDVEFVTNLSLPPGVGLGKHVSLGFGELSLDQGRTSAERT